MAKKKKEVAGKPAQEFTVKEKELAGNILNLQTDVHNNAKYISSAHKGKIPWKDRDRLIVQILASYDALTDTVLKMMLIKDRAENEKA